MRHLLRWVTINHPARVRTFSTVANRLGSSTGGINLAKIGVASVTLGSGIYIYATSRQLAHIDSPEYRPPADWSSSAEEASAHSPLSKAKHQLRYEILQETAQWMLGCGLLLGGYNRLWRMSSRAAKLLTKGPETFRGRLVSNGLFAASTLAIMVTTDLVSSRIYQRFSAVPVQDDWTAIIELSAFASTAFRTIYGQDDPKKIKQATKWPDWMNWGLAGMMGTVVVGIPLLVSIAVYERLGPNAVKPMTKALVVAAGCTGAMNYLSPNLNHRPKDTRIYYGQCTELAEWSKQTQTKFDVAELASKVQAMLGPGPEIKLVVMPDHSEKVDPEDLREVLGLIVTPIIQEHKGYLYSDRKKEGHGFRYVCLFPRHLKNLDLDVNLALIADVLTEDMKPNAWEGAKFGVFAAASLAAFGGIMQLFYARNPAVLLSIFPSLQAEATRHIPLMVSLSTTSALSVWFWPVGWVQSYMSKQRVRDRDLVIAEYGPEVTRGWQQLLQLRGQAWKTIEETEAQPDIGTTDPIYAFVRALDASTTERVIDLDQSSGSPSTART